jgi:hypothetical protein
MLFTAGLWRYESSSEITMMGAAASAVLRGVCLCCAMPESRWGKGEACCPGRWLCRGAHRRGRPGCFTLRTEPTAEFNGVALGAGSIAPMGAPWVLALASSALLRSSALRPCRQSEAAAGLPGAGPPGVGPLTAHCGSSAWACPSRSARPTALMIVSALAPAITDRSANFLIISSPVRAGLMPSLPPGFREPETLRQGRGDACRPGSRLRRCPRPVRALRAAPWPWPVRVAGDLPRTRPRQQL